MSPWYSTLWHWAKGDIVGVPGVVYSDQMTNIAEELEQQMAVHWGGNLRNVSHDSVSDLLAYYSSPESAQPGPEEEPYTFWERVGLVPVHPSRVRARQYYHAVTDFGVYDYDEVSPEEKELTAKWLARVMEFNGAIPAGVLCVAGCLVLPLHTVYRMPLLVGAGLTGVAIEITRSYMAASKQRQDLDDFILAKEIWYIKNVETYQLGLPRMPRGREAEYQAYVTADANQQHGLPDKLLDDLHYD